MVRRISMVMVLSRYLREASLPLERATAAQTERYQRFEARGSAVRKRRRGDGGQHERFRGESGVVVGGREGRVKCS